MTVLRIAAALGVMLPLSAASPGTPRPVSSASGRGSMIVVQDTAKKSTRTTTKKKTSKSSAKTPAKATAKTTAKTSASKAASTAKTTPNPSPTGAANAAPNSAAAGASPAGSVTVNRFMTYSASAKTVSLDVIAALTSQQGGFNFNGGSNGSHTITIPQGWTVRMHVKNVDAIPHSALVIADQRPLPNAPETPAIPRAYTSHLNDGLAPQTGADDVEFRASKPGNYLIYCAVPGHGPSGMYIKLVISADAATPAYAM